MKSLTQKQIEHNPNNALRLRVMRVMAELPGQWLKPYMDMYPSENNAEGVNKIRNIAAMRTFDESKVAQLEALSQSIKHS